MSFRIFLVCVAMFGCRVCFAADDAWRTVRVHDQFFAEGASSGDINGDGAIDIVAGPLCFLGPGFNESIQIASPRTFPITGYSDQFFSEVFDANRDGANDVLVLGFPGKSARLYLNPGAGANDQAWAMHEVAEGIANESPTIVDFIPGGLPEIVCGHGGTYGFYSAPENPLDQWTWNAITRPDACKGKFTHGLGVGDVDGDGRMDVLDRSFWWQQPEQIDTNQPWTRHRWAEGNGYGGAQIHVDDFDDDGDADILTSLEAHGYGLAWFEQTDPNTFVRHDIMGSSSIDNEFGVVFSQLHAVALHDMNADGVKDIVTGKRWMAHRGKDIGGLQEPVLYWFETVRNAGKVEFIPRLIDRDSGVGVDVLVADLNDDRRPDVVSCSKRGLSIHFQSGDIVDAVPARWKRTEGRDQSTYADGLEAGQAARHVLVDKGFSVDLIASEPELTQPVAMCFDARGRIWVVEGHTYPTKAPQGQGRDRVVIFSDEDADGSFETKKTFIEGLNLASGIEVGFGGVWIGAAPELLFIPDADQDGTPDGDPRTMLTGWGYHDTHEVLNSFTWGPDGWLYGCQGVFTHSQVRRPDQPEDQAVPMNAGVWRYHPTEHRFEVFAHGTSNPWGVDFNDEGEWFISACVIPHLYHIFQGGRYQRQAGQHFNSHTYDDIKTIADHAHYAGNIRDHAFWGDNKTTKPSAPIGTSQLGGGHAHCGLAIYNGGVFPTSYHGELLFHNLHGHRVVRESVQSDGSGYVGKHRPDFALARDHQEIGVGVMVGPDGAVYTSDWHDIQTCHNRTPEVWDRTDGRLFRIRYGEVAPYKFDLWKESDEQLVSRLNSDNGFFARQAQRILQERAAQNALNVAGVTRLLGKIIDTGTQRDRLRAIWTMWCIGAIDQAILTDLMRDHDATVRAWAVHFVGESFVDNKASRLVSLQDIDFHDDSAVVRRYAASLLQRLPLKDRWPVIETLVGYPIDAHDRNLPFLVWYGLEPLVEGDPDRAYEIAKKSGWSDLLRFTVRRITVTASGRDSLVARLIDPANRPQRLLILEELVASATRRGGVDMPRDWDKARAVLGKAPLPRVRQLTRSFGVQVGDENVFPAFRAILKDTSKPTQQRLEALAALRVGRDREIPDIAYALLNDAQVSKALVSALAPFDEPRTAEMLLRHFDRFDEPTRTAALGVLVSRASWANELVSAMQSAAVPPESVPAFIVRQAVSLGDEALNERLEETWGRITESNEEKAASYERYRALLKPRAIARSDARHGRQLYEANCGKCHKMFGIGGDIGPDITGANRTKVDYWLENILEPNALIGKAYLVTTVLATDGRVISGVIKEENDDALTLQTVSEIVVISNADIEEMRASKISLMPEGQLQPMSDRDVLSLFKYLMAPGQVPLPVDDDGAVSTKASAPPIAGAPATPSKPNFVVIFCDDMGYADIGPFGAEGYQTPNLDQVAAEGMVFTDFHVARSFCSPSRAALLTGRYPQEVGVPTNFGPTSKNGMTLGVPTIANVLKDVGYQTACFGKWHLGHQPEFLPPRRGFDEYFGLPYSNDMWPLHPENGTRYHFPDLPLMEGTDVIKSSVTPEDQMQFTRWFTERAVTFIEGQNETPFFLYLPHAMPHVPLYASQDFVGKTRRGSFGDVIEEIDWSVGQIRAALQRQGLDDKTLLIFTSDNGPWLRYGDHAGSAGILRAGKGSVYEGGYRVPCVMRWPGIVPAGTTCSTFAATVDLMPTFASLAGAELPTPSMLDGKDIRRQLLGLKTNPHQPRTFIHFKGAKPAAVRHGKWKLILPQKYRKPIAGTGGIPGDWEAAQSFPLALYNLQDDVSETTNLAGEHPEVVAKLQAMIDAARPGTAR